MSEEGAPRKRSRFDQTEPPAQVRKSRFDRRSRSPAKDDAEPRRDRSPVEKSIESPGSKSKADAAAAAAAAAARINDSIKAKQGIQHVDVPPIRPNPSPAAAGASKSPSQATDSGTLNAEIYQQDGDYIRDIEVNDLRNRYTLTKGSTQKMIKEKTGADVTTRGNYYPDKTMATTTNPPLYLHITSQTKEGLEQAVEEINELMKQELPNLIDERRFRRREPEPQVERDSLGRRKWPEERIPIDLEPIPGFNLRAQVVGQGGSYVKYIQQETRCRVQIKGRGSGFMEHDTQRESDEQMYLHVAGPDAGDVQEAKKMCLELLGSVKEQYESFKERGPRERGPPQSGGGYDGPRGGRSDSNHYHRDRNGSGNYDQYSTYNQPQTPMSGGGYTGGAQSPQTAAYGQQLQQQQQVMDPAQVAAWIEYYNVNPDQDPYKDYGGYAAMMAQYYGAMQQQQQGQMGMQQGYAGSPVQQNGSAGDVAPPPPPPGGDDVPPPPPPPPGA